MLSACVSAQGQLSREALWALGGHINTRWSVEDALTQGLSRKVTRDDWHSHQIMLRRKNGQTIYQQSALVQSWNSTLCTDSQDSRDWAALECRVRTACSPLSETRRSARVMLSLTFEHCRPATESANLKGR